ncbi:Uncharacterized membrane protein [Geoalkalibacter ferrihydriticus]|uniref:DUF1622 domain-containing protein n=2 Tax=Geoalkalibacter ferrihydriticus TaxID=392333 RepID=A0A0C2HQ35_9BACT|nr:DUF1622 domain-containing protein [Geoalkalibacter ferrihydriticus]KIH77010.1 hypothetical protein GFER_08080 [Geoalkalibacter ferrihydriticus DSM 17813]SDL39347.1 Uncharacterized membrane protein [Geoalkalibacter ferrihydriticus]
MIEVVKPFAEWCAGIVEILGIAMITLSALYSIGWGIAQRIKTGDDQSALLIWQKIRQRMGRGILLGLEFLIAADIIHTVAVEFTFEAIGVLALIVLIRTFLSFTLELEIEGRWPWQKRE